MALKSKSIDEYIDSYLPGKEQIPLFRGSIPPEVQVYMVTLSSLGYTDDEIGQTIKMINDGVLS